MYKITSSKQNYVCLCLNDGFSVFQRLTSGLILSRDGNCRMTKRLARPCSKSNSIQFRRMSMSAISFPWQLSTIDLSKDDPVYHKLVGFFMLRKIIKNYSREDFDVRDFLDGVKHAVQGLSYCICTHDKDNKLVHMLGSNLHTVFRQTFDSMKKNKRRVILEVEATRDYKLSGIRTICGGTDEGDEYEIKFLGQRIIASKRDMFELEKHGDSKGYFGLFQHGKHIGISAAEKQIRFQIDVKFTTNERFYVEEERNGHWDMIFGEKDLVTSRHKLRFESFLEDQEETDDKYPLSWKIVDIDFVDEE